MNLEIVNNYHPDNLIVFMHLYKTGGTSVEETFRDIYGANYVLANPGDILSRTNRRSKALAGHISFHSNDISILKNLNRDLYTITLFREPIDRVLSDYYWIKHYDYDYVVPCRSESISVWFEQGFTRGINTMTTFFSGTNSETEATVEAAQTNILNSINYFGLLTKYDEFINKCSNILEWKRIPNQKHAKQNLRRPLEEDPDTIALIKNYNQKDIELYDWIVEQYNS